MRVTGIIHQQICQLRWHLLACLGLLMLLPIEEALVNLRAGSGFYSLSLVIATVIFSPLLVGLIACANVQGDLDERRYIFWRSKPANIKLLMTVKFSVGLVASLLVLACPLVFALLTIVLFAEERVERENMYSVPFFVLVGVMTYSLCFACNVLVRKSARAWLIGMLLAGLLLVLPFILPLNFRDFVTDIRSWAWGSYLAIILGASAAAFVFSLYATQHDWHLKTNLKGLLWVGAGLLLVLMILFSSQVANIKVLDEREIDSSSRQRTLDSLDNRIIFQGHSYVDIDKEGISLRPIGSFRGSEEGPFPIHSNIGTDSTGRRFIYGQGLRSLREKSYSHLGGQLYRSVGNDIYDFTILAYYRIEGEGPHRRSFYEKIYLRSYKLTEESWAPVGEIDLSDCLANGTRLWRVEMRLIDNVIVACMNRSCVRVDVTNPVELKRIDTKLDALKMPQSHSPDREKEFAIPLLPMEGIDIQERIRLSIDLNYHIFYGSDDVSGSSLVDINDGGIAFFLASGSHVARFDVTRWDRENIYCKFSTARPFTILESIGTVYFRDAFVKGGKLYCYGQDTLLVFDIRSGSGIRKLGHFVRMDYSIEDVAILDDGNILLSLRWERNLSQSDPDKRKKSYLCLLKNPA